MPFLNPFFGWEGSPTKIDDRKKKRYPCSNLSTGGPRGAVWLWCLFLRLRCGSVKCLPNGSQGHGSGGKPKESTFVSFLSRFFFGRFRHISIFPVRLKTQRTFSPRVPVAQWIPPYPMLVWLVTQSKELVPDLIQGAIIAEASGRRFPTFPGERPNPHWPQKSTRVSGTLRIEPAKSMFGT